MAPEPSNRGPVPGLPEGAADLPDAAKTVELVGRLKKGDRAAMNELFRRYQPRLRRVVGIKMGGWLRARCDPDDIVQDACVVAMEKLGDFELRGHASVLQWLTRIAEYQISNKIAYHRALQRDSVRERRLSTGDPSSSDILPGPAVADPGPTPSQVHLRSELETILDECVGEIEPDDYREIVLMRDYYGADWETIRRQLGRPSLEAVQELHRRAREKLRERLRRRGMDL